MIYYKENFMQQMELSFAKYREEDYDDFYSIVQEDDVMKYITGKGLSREQARNKFNAILQLNAADELLGYFKVFIAGNVLIGDCKLVPYKHDPALLEIGYLLKSEYWGKGYGTRICQQMLSLADESFPANDVIGLIDPENTASKRLLEKFGFNTCFTGIEDELPTEKLMLKKS